MPIKRIQGKTLEDGAVTTSKIANNSVTSAKLLIAPTPKIVSVTVVDNFNAPTGNIYGSVNNTRIRILGNNFVIGAQIFAEACSANGFMQAGYLANTIIFNDSTNLYAIFSGIPQSLFNLYLVNPDSGVGFSLVPFGAV